MFGEWILLILALYTTKIGDVINATLYLYVCVFLRNSTLIVGFVYLICLICGRFGVAFLGSVHNLDDMPEHQDAPLRPYWVNLTSTFGKMQGSVSGDEIEGKLCLAPYNPPASTNKLSVKFDELKS